MSKLTRSVFVALALLGALVEGYSGNHNFAALCAFAAAVLIYGHFRYGTTAAAFLAYRRGALDEVAARLVEVRHPTLLAPKTRAHYEFLKGIVAHRDGAFADADKHLGAALEGGLRTTHLVAVARMHLADVALQSGDKDAATRHLDSARAAPHQPALDKVIAELDERVSKA